MKLIDVKTGQEIPIGQEVTTFRGRQGTLKAAYPPRHQGSSGKVLVTFEDIDIEYFPSVIGATFTVKGEAQ